LRLITGSNVSSPWLCSSGNISEVVRGACIPSDIEPRFISDSLLRWYCAAVCDRTNSLADGEQERDLVESPVSGVSGPLDSAPLVDGS
jgi:hypothetical protein